MPTISMFYGIAIKMYNTREHNPPHFHAEYQDTTGVFNFDGELIEGNIPIKQQKFIEVWATMRKSELEENWKQVEQRKPLSKIEPLK